MGSMFSPLPVIIAGAGIGGLSAAVALSRRGIQVQVIERAPELLPLGAGLVLSSNAMEALHTLGLAEAVLQMGSALQVAELRRPDGSLLQALPLDNYANRFGHPSVGIHRGALQTILLEPVADRVATRTTLVDFTQETEGVLVQLASGQERRGSALVGADGLRSRVRALLWGDEPPRYAGYTCWRGIAENFKAAPFDEGYSCETWGRGARFGAVSIGGDRVYWFAVLNGPAGKVLGGAAGHAELLEHFASWHAPIADLLAHTPPESVLHSDIHDRHPLPQWSKGQTTLLGDAAHPSTPNLGQGAGMALEDAVILAHAMAQHGTTPAGLHHYERARGNRTAKVVRRSRKLGQVGQADRPFSCTVRNAIMRATPGWVVTMQMRDLLRFRAP